MFNAVTQVHANRSGRFSAGVLFSVGLHVAVLAGVLWVTRSRPEVPAPLSVLVFRSRPGPARPRPSASEAPAKPRVHTKTRLARHPILAAPVSAPLPPSLASAAEDGASEGDASSEGDEGVPGGIPGGMSTGGGEEVFGLGTKGLSAPLLMQDAPFEYPREAREAQVEGVVLVRCIIRADGATEDCRILKGLPLLSDAVLASMRLRRYRPAQFEGRPVKVEMVITVRLRLRR